MKGRSLFRASWHLQGVSAVNQDVRLRSLVKDLNSRNYSETEDWGLVGYWRARKSFNSVRYIRLWESARTKLSVFGEQLWTQLFHHGAVVGSRNRRGGHRRPGSSYLLWYHDRLLHILRCLAESFMSRSAMKINPKWVKYGHPLWSLTQSWL